MYMCTSVLNFHVFLIIGELCISPTLYFKLLLASLLFSYYYVFLLLMMLLLSCFVFCFLAGPRKKVKTLWITCLFEIQILPLISFPALCIFWETTVSYTCQPKYVIAIGAFTNYRRDAQYDSCRNIVWVVCLKY